MDVLNTKNYISDKLNCIILPEYKCGVTVSLANQTPLFLELNSSSDIKRPEGTWLSTFFQKVEKQIHAKRINHTTFSQQTTHTRSLPIWVSLFIFLEDNLSCSLSPKKVFGQTTFFFHPCHNFRFETTCLLTRNAAKK